MNYIRKMIANSFEELKRLGQTVSKPTKMGDIYPKNVSTLITPVPNPKSPFFLDFPESQTSLLFVKSYFCQLKLVEFRLFQSKLPD
jgi:hypothetical protein